MRKKGTPEQVAAYDEADRALQANPDRTETDRYLDLNDRVWETSRPLSGWQQSPLARDLREVRQSFRELARGVHAIERQRAARNAEVTGAQSTAALLERLAARVCRRRSR
jgi:hypothetical protein